MLSQTMSCPTNGIFWTRLRLLPLLTAPTARLPLLLPLRLQHHPLLHPALPLPAHQVQPCVIKYGNVNDDKVLGGL